MKRTKENRVNAGRIVAIIAAILVAVIAAVIAVTYSGKVANEESSEAMVQEIISESVSEDNKKESNAFLKFASAKEVNENAVGWISIDGTNIDYPILQASNNSHYLDYSFEEKRNLYGSIFMDSNFKDFSGTTSVLYGHSVTGDKEGRMFSDLKKFESADFVEEHSNIAVATETGINNYVVVACFWTTASASEDNGYVFNYIYNDIEQNDIPAFFNECQKRSFWHSSEEVTEADKLLILSTCTRGLDKYSASGRRLARADGRLVVVAKFVDAETSVSYETNANPKMPSIYYQNNGLVDTWSRDGNWYPSAKAVA